MGWRIWRRGVGRVGFMRDGGGGRKGSGHLMSPVTKRSFVLVVERRGKVTSLARGGRKGLTWCSYVSKCHMDTRDHTWSCILQEVEQDLTWLCGSWARFAPSVATAFMPVLFIPEAPMGIMGVTSVPDGQPHSLSPGSLTKRVQSSPV